MIITRTPYRISFFGGGTDYPAWYREEGGAVLSTSINKYCYITCRYLPPFFPITHRIVWSHIEGASTISEILHPAVREGLRMMAFDDSRGVEIHHQGDLPARSGMGSSSAFAVGLLSALKALKGNVATRPELYEMAIQLEQDCLGDNVGSQDQVATAMGGFNRIQFQQNGSIEVRPVDVPKERLKALNGRLMLFFSGTSRMSSEVAGRVVRSLAEKRTELRHMRAMVDQGLEILGHGELDDFGRLLDQAWKFKKSLSSAISNPVIDEAYGAACQAGALGGKLLGAGASGFMVFYVPEGRQNSVREALRGLMHVPFSFEDQGSTILVNRESWA